MSNASRPTFSRAGLVLRLCVCALLAAPSVSAGTAATGPAIPPTAKGYRVETFQEQLESFSVTRLRLRGPIAFTMDPIPGFQSAPGQAPTAFVHYTTQAARIDLRSFAAEDFGTKLSAQSLTAYLDRLAASHAPKQNFEILETPAVTNGPARFRFLGKRALTLRYAFDQEGVRTVRAENWVEAEGFIHVISIEAPAGAIDRHFEAARASFNASAPAD